MLCFISIPSLCVKIHTWGQYFRDVPCYYEQNILFAKNTLYSSSLFLEILHHLRPPPTHTHTHIYIYIYIYIKQVFKTAISGAKILIHITIVLAPERAVVKTYHL